MSKEGFYNFAKSNPNWKEDFQSIDFMMTLIDLIDEEHYKNEEDATAVEILKYWSRGFAEKNFEVCFDVAESPIERIFLSQLIIAFHWHSPFLLIVAPSDLGEFFSKMERAFANDEKVMRLSAETGRLPGHIAKEILPKEEFNEHLFYKIYRDFGCLDSVYMFPQLSFAGSSKMGEKYRPLERFRVDLYLTKLDDIHHLIVECDGYEWHKDRFIEDRKRDRAFKSAGFNVLRFSGSEIVRDPISCAVELFDYIKNNWKFEYFFQDDSV